MILRRPIFFIAMLFVMIGSHSIHSSPGRPYRLKTLPKAGTHLLESVLKDLGYDVYGPPHHLHYPDTPGLCKLDPEMRYIVLIRDPRDILVSLIHHIDRVANEILNEGYSEVFGITRDKKLLREWLSFTPSEKLSYAITCNEKKGIDFHWIITQQWREAQKVIKNISLPENCILLRFEDLVDSQHGGDNLKQVESMLQLTEHLGLNLSEERLQSILFSSWGKGGKYFRNGNTQEWKIYFTRKNILEFKTKWNDVLLDFGYEENENWDQNYI